MNNKSNRKLNLVFFSAVLLFIYTIHDQSQVTLFLLVFQGSEEDYINPTLHHTVLTHTQVDAEYLLKHGVITLLNRELRVQSPQSL